MEDRDRLNWRKSSYSGNGGGECVEVAVWRKSSHSGNGGGNCVEVGTATHIIAVRDTKDRSGPMLRFGPAGWRAFVAGVRAGEIDLNEAGRLP